MTESIDALVVGGGPVGLFAALCLNERGVSVRVVDAEWERLSRAYACGLHPQTLRLLDELGIVSQISERAHRVDRLTIYRGFEKVGSAYFGDLSGPLPHVMTMKQAELEDTFAAALQERGVPVVWRHEVTQLRLSDEFIEITAVPKRMISLGYPESRREQRRGTPSEWRARYAVAADGYFSPCRTALGIAMNSLEETEAFAMFEFTADLADLQHEAAIVVDEESISAFWPLGPETGRFTFQVWDQLDETPSPERMTALLRARVPWFNSVVEQVSWSTITRFERLIAGQFGRDRIWLAGDAAHVTGPIGFQSMNMGFIEAHALASIIADALQGNVRASEGFEEFESIQQSEWRRLLGIETRVLGRPGLSASHAARLVPCLPSTGDDLDLMMAQLGLSFV